MPNLDARNTELELLHPDFRARALAVLEEAQREGLPFRIFEAFRSPARQNYLFAKGRTSPGSIVTYVRAWGSYHQYGLAADYVLFIDGKWSWDTGGEKDRWWKRLHQIGEAHGLERLKFETPHLQLAGLSVEDLRRGHYPPGGDLTWAENLEAAIVGWTGQPAAPPVPAVLPERPPVEEPVLSLPDLANSPRPGESDWHRMHGGREWRYDERGIYVRDYMGGTSPLRTPGEPTTCRAIWKAFAPHILAAAIKYNVSPALILMVIATETGFARKFGFTGMHTFRWEPNVKVTDVAPPILGDYSAGPMQTLASTVRWTIRQQRLDYDPFVVAPVFNGRPAPPSVHPLYDPATNIDLGTAEMVQRWSITDGDPILVSAAFNSGGLYKTAQNPWHLRTHGNHLERAAAWYGDACTVLADVNQTVAPTPEPA